MANGTNTDATFIDAWYSRMVGKYWGCHSSAPVDINK